MSRRFFLLIALLLFPAPTFAQPLPDRRPIVGVAVDGDGKPLGGAVISLRRESDTGSAAFWGASTASDASGHFRFGAAEVGRYFLNAELPGYAPISNQWVVWDAASAPLHLRLDHLVTLRLQLARPDGSPAANASLWVRLRGDGQAGQTTRRVSGDATGRASLADLIPANYALFAASGDGFATQNGLALRADATQTLALQPGGSLRVTVKQNGTGRLLGGAQLVLVPENASEAQRLSGDAANIEEDFGLLAARGDRLLCVSRDGDSLIALQNVPPGRYRARISLAGFSAAETQMVTVTAGQSSEISWNLAPKTEVLTSLTLQLRAKVGSPAVAGEYVLRLLPIGENGALEPEQDTPFQPGGNPGRRVVADESGKITLFPLAPGRYRVFVAPRTPGRELEDGPAEAASLDVSIPPMGATAALTLK